MRGLTVWPARRIGTQPVSNCQTLIQLSIQQKRVMTVESTWFFKVCRHHFNPSQVLMANAR